MNVYFSLNINVERVYFPNAVSGLKQIETELWKKLDNILNSSEYQKAKILRNNVTHNYLPSSAGLAITTKRGGKTITTGLGIREYTTSKEIMNNVLKILGLFQETVSAVTER